MAEQSRILRLAEEIHKSISDIDSGILNNRGEIPFPNFEDGTDSFECYDSYNDMRLSLLDHINELRDLLLSLCELLLQGSSSANFLALHTTQRFKLAQCIPIGERRSYAQISKACRLPEITCRRLIRQACLMRVFKEVEPDVVEHTSASKLLVENEYMGDYVGAVCEEVWPAALKVADAMEKWPVSSDPKQGGYMIANGMSSDELFERDEKRRNRYARSMKAFAGDRNYAFDNVVGDYNWAALGKGKVVDIGGSHGDVSKVLAKAYPDLSFTVEDLPSVLDQRPTDSISDDIKDRITFLPHDVFEPQPVHDADVYYFRSVMLDWEDDKVVKILQATKPALKPGAVMLIQDPSVPEPGTIPEVTERRYRATDMLLLALRNGRLRGIGEWKGLFEQAGPGFELRTASFLPESGKSLIEAIWVGGR